MQLFLQRLSILGQKGGGYKCVFDVVQIVCVPFRDFEIDNGVLV